MAEEEQTYIGTEVMKMLGISYRQFDYWVRRLGWRHLQSGSGTQRHLTEDEVHVLRVLAGLRKQEEAIHAERERLYRVNWREAERAKEVVR